MSVVKAKKTSAYAIVLVLAAALVTGVSVARAAEPSDDHRTVVTADFLRVAREVRRLSLKYGPDEVLLVLDIDNTLLAMDQDLGSDQWFGWQRELLKSKPDSRMVVANDFGGLLKVQGMLFALSRMHPPEPDLPIIVRELQQLGIRSLVLTSRGPEFRNATERELAQNGYVFGDYTLKIVEQRGLFAPFDIDNPGRHGLSAGEAESFEGKLRFVSYSQGVFMVAGQHKGYLLRSLLARVRDESDVGGYLPKAIVFVDDRLRHVEDVLAAFKTLPVDLVAIRYSREDGNVKRFEQADKKRVDRDWRTIENAIHLALPRQSSL